ncbi:MAG: putative Na+/H+ antiporter [Planctomycetaceae bacterium]|nr:putative Na+/H+ antiporter [Planctomycetaceae bacterium]
MNPNSQEILATVLFACAVIHTFCVNRFARWAHRYPEGSVGENLFHFLAETEVVFGIWASVLFVGIAVLNGSIDAAVKYIDSLSVNFTEPKFVLVVMVVAATRPIVNMAEAAILWIARLLPLKESVSFYIAALSCGTLLGSFITEPAAMTLLALLLKRRYFDRNISKTLAYATIGLLFVNVSIGGTLTHFAAPPVLMVATPWHWNSFFMVTTFGWRAVASCLCSTLLIALVFRRQLSAVEPDTTRPQTIPAWLTILHFVFLASVVAFAHHPDIFFGIFMIFLGLVTATREYQDSLKLREGLLVGFFLAGLVTLGKPQAWWLDPLIKNPQMTGDKLYFGTTALTAITDNAALTYLGTQVENLSSELKYALVAGAVSGGGLTVIANAPNPAGAGILQSSRAFGEDGLNPVLLLCGAIPPTLIAVGFFWLIA